MAPSYLLWAIWIAVISTAIFVCLFKPSWVPALIAMVLPLRDFDFNWGVTWSPAKAVVLLFLASIPAHLALRSRFPTWMRLPSTLRFFLLAVVASTITAYLAGSHLVTAGFGAFRGPLLRPIVQIFSLCLRVAILLAVVGLVRSERATYKLLKAVLASSTLLAAYGLYQFFGYYLRLPGVLAIWYAPGRPGSVYGMFQVGGVTIFRLGSYAGEPKMAAAALLPGILLIVLARALNLSNLRGWLTSYPVLALHCSAFLLTFATSSFYAAIVSFPVILWVCMTFRGRTRKTTTLVAATVASTVLLGLCFFVGPNLAGRIGAVRLGNRFSLRQGDPAAVGAIGFLARKPGYAIAGVGLGNASFYLRPYFDPNAAGRPLTISFNSAYLGLLFETGILGLAGFLAFLFATFFHGLRLLPSIGPGESGALLATVLALCAATGILNAFWSVGPALWLYWGLLVSLSRRLEAPHRVAQRRRSALRPCPFPALVRSLETRH